MVIHRIAVVVDEVVAMHIVHETVLVVVEAVAGNLPGIGPDIGRQIGMRVVDARVNHANDDGAAPGRDSPRLRSVDVGVNDASCLSRVVEAVELGIGRIVGSR